MNCPKCDYEQKCPCKHCGNKKKESWIWIKGEWIRCRGCGLTEHCDYWLDVAHKEYKLWKA